MRYHDVPGWMTTDELAWIAEQAAKARVVVEVGVWKGRSTACWCAHTAGTVFAVDAWPADGCGCQAYEEIRRHGRDAVRGDAVRNLAVPLASGRLFLLEMRSGAAAGVLAGVLRHRGADVVFIDGDHGLTAVQDDVRAYLPLVRPGGLLCGHDYPEVRASLDAAGLAVRIDPPRCGTIWWHEVRGDDSRGG